MLWHRGMRGHVNEWTPSGTAEPAVTGGGRAEHQTQAATIQSSTSYRVHKVVRQAVKKSGCTIRSMCHAMGMPWACDAAADRRLPTIYSVRQ